MTNSTIEIVTGYTLIKNGRDIYETLDVYEAFRMAGKFNAIVEKCPPSGDNTYYRANGEQVMIKR